MGVIDRTIAESSTTDDSGEQNNTQSNSRARSTPDTFLNEFDTSRIKLDDETVSRLLSIAVVITNLLN